MNNHQNDYALIRRTLTLAERRQAVGMSQAGLIHHSVIDRLVQRS
jgi:hypothetical protein